MHWWAEFFTIIAGIAAIIALIPLAPLIIRWGLGAWVRLWLEISRESPIRFHVTKKEVSSENGDDLVGVYIEINVRARDGYSRKVRKFYPLICLPFKVKGESGEQVSSMELDGTRHTIEETCKMFKPFVVTKDETEIRLRASFNNIDLSKDLRSTWVLSTKYQVDNREFIHKWPLDYKNILT